MYEKLKTWVLILGHLYYRHDGSDNLEDSFKFKVRDFYGLETEVQTMRIIAEQNDLLKPWPSEAANYTLTLNESTILPIGAAELEYFDDFSGPDDLTYQVVKACHCVKARVRTMGISNIIAPKFVTYYGMTIWELDRNWTKFQGIKS